MTNRQTSLAFGIVNALGCTFLLDIPEDPPLANSQLQNLPGASVEVDPEQPSASVQDGGLGPQGMSVGVVRESPPSDAVALEDLGLGEGDSGDVEVEDTAAEEAPLQDAGVTPSVEQQPTEPTTSVADAGAPPEPFVPDPCQSQGALGPNQNCFLVLGEALPWAEARLACQSQGEGWDLAAIHSLEVDEFVAQLSEEEMWIGGSDSETDGEWRWVTNGVAFWSGGVDDGVPVDDSYVHWNPGEPNGGGPSGCARLLPALEGTWGDLECESERMSLCEGPKL